MENAKSCKTFVFCVPGEPTPMRYPITSDSRFWNSTKQLQLQYKFLIQKQFEKQIKYVDPQPLKGNVQLTIHFFLTPKQLRDMPKLKQKNLGFTLIELLVVSTIIIVLATIGVVSYRNASMNSRNAKRKPDLEVVRQAMIMYRSEEGSYPSAANFNALVVALHPKYLTESNIKDPKNSPYPQYSYGSDSNGIFLQYIEEPGSEGKKVRLP